MMRDEEFEEAVLRFEQDWQRGAAADIAAYLGRPDRLAPHDAHRLLVELISIDLEFRWRAARGDAPWTLETYAGRFPQLGTLDELPRELIAEEYRCRRKWGDRPTHEVVLSRFGARREQIRADPDAVDAELVAESIPARATTHVPLAASLPRCSQDDFLFHRMIGAGRMGKVYHATQLSTHQDCAVKFLRKSYLQDSQVVGRFIAEACTIAALRHPHIVGTAGLGCTKGGSHFIVMDLVRGPNLADRMTSQAAPIPDALSWVIQTCDALAHAHARGIIHCDLKPANLLLDEHGAVRVTDFGLARHVGGGTPHAAAIEGTAPFMAPEQARGDDSAVDPRTDVYGLGAVLYTLLTGRPPFMGRDLSEILANVAGPAPVVPPVVFRDDIPIRVSDVCGKCLAKSPRERFATIDDVRAALNEASDHS